MIAVVQRVGEARVDVAGETVGKIPGGLLILAGVRKGDTAAHAEVLADRIAGLRIFEDEGGRMNRSVIDVGRPVLVVSQFTLCADLRRGRRPGFDGAAPPTDAVPRLEEFVGALKAQGLTVEQGRFGATMDVHLVNQGPATFLLDSADWLSKSDCVG